MRRFRLFFASLLGIYAISGLTQVRPEERAVVRRFGAIVAIWEPGLHIGLPIGIDRIDRIAVASVRNLVVGNQPGTGPMLTADQNLVQVQVAIEYTVDGSPEGIADYLRQRDQADLVLARTAESLIAEWIASNDVDSTLLTGSVEIPRWLMQEIPIRLTAQRLGILVQQASVGALTPPDEVKPAFEQVNQAQTAIRTQEYRARQEADQRLRLASTESIRQRQQAQSYRDERLSAAKAEAQAFAHRMEQYQRLKQTNPAILEAIWWDEMGRMLAGMKARGRIDLLDAALGPDGLDITQMIPPVKP